MMDVRHSLLLVAVIAAVTLFLRALPFLVFGRGREAHPTVIYLGKVLPYAIIGMLVVYCLKGITFLQPPYGISELIAAAVVVLLHVWKRKTLLSIGVGTVCYMLLVQLVF